MFNMLWKKTNEEKTERTKNKVKAEMKQKKKKRKKRRKMPYQVVAKLTQIVELRYFLLSLSISILSCSLYLLIRSVCHSYFIPIPIKYFSLADRENIFLSRASKKNDFLSNRHFDEAKFI